MILMGDSSGGGFALALAQNLRVENIKLRQLILLSPWLDITLTNPLIKYLDPEDPFLEAESLKQAGTLYSKGINADHYLLSPINGSLKGLGKISVFIGSKDLLVADARRLRDRAQMEGIDLNYFEYDVSEPAGIEKGKTSNC
jgi:acetyl esterase/lipase